MRPNKSMKPTSVNMNTRQAAPLGYKFSVFATTPCRSEERPCRERDDIFGVSVALTSWLGIALHRLRRGADLRSNTIARHLALALDSPCSVYGLRRLRNSRSIQRALEYVANSSYHRQSGRCIVSYSSFLPYP